MILRAAGTRLHGTCTLTAAAKHPAGPRLDRDGDSGYSMSIRSSFVIRSVQNDNNKSRTVIQQNATGSLSSILANLF